tara:strand:- start:88 stop:681 length:594 start_codon:yes stop_codon:yes gene_type:complete
MKKVGYIEYNLKYFQENINIKDLCDYHLKNGAGTTLIQAVISSVAFDRSKKEERFEFSNPSWPKLDDLENKVQNDFWKPKNEKFCKLIENHEWEGTLLSLISKNFKIIYKFEFDDLLTLLLYSKYGNEYYYIPQVMIYDKKTKDRYTDYIGEVKKFKKKPNKMEFLKLFMHPKDMVNKKFIKEVIKNNGVPFEALKW